MCKKISLFLVLFVFYLTALFGEWLGNLSVEEGKPSPTEEGLILEHGTEGFVQIFIYNDRFAVLFLDANRRVKARDDIDLVTVYAQSDSSGGEFYPFHLQPVAGGLYFWNPRHVYKPHRYNVEVVLRKAVKKFPRYRGRKEQTRFVRESLGVHLLDQK